MSRDIKKYFYKIFNANPEIPKLSRKYGFVMPVFTDLHLLFEEGKNRTQYINRSISLLCNLVEFLELNEVKYFCLAGDLYDSGKETISTSLLNLYEHCFYNLINDRTGYVVEGNHEEHFRKNNLFYAMTDIQSSFLKNKKYKLDGLLPTLPYFKATDSITIGNSKVYFMHYDANKQYYISSKDTFNIAIFHEDILTLESKNSLYHHKAGMGIDIETTNIMDNVDIAICAHIHKPMQTFRMNNTRRTQVIIPGALCQRTRAEDHEIVQIPVICMDKGCNPIIEFVPFNLGAVQETINKEVDDKQVKQRQISKEIKQIKGSVQGVDTFEEYLKTLSPEIRSIVEKAESPYILDTVAEYRTNKF